MLLWGRKEVREPCFAALLLPSVHFNRGRVQRSHACPRHDALEALTAVAADLTA